MRHEFVVTEENETKINALIQAATSFTGGTAEIVMIKKVVTEDERLAGILDNLLNFKEKPYHNTRPGGAPKVWTIVATQEKVSQSVLTGRTTDHKIDEGTAVFHEERGNYVVDRKENGSLTLKKVLA
jgi:hypothetical protein